MLRKLKDIYGYKIQATDDKIGQIHDFYFDDQSWAIHYFVIDTGAWLSGRKVLLAPDAVEQPDWVNKVIPVSLSREQVENSPSIDTETPVSRQQEETLRSYYGWPPVNRMGGGLFDESRFGMGIDSIVNTVEAGLEDRTDKRQPSVEFQERIQPHLRSAKEVFDYYIQAQDGQIGHVEDFLVNDDNWGIYYIVIDTRNWLPGRKVLVSPAWIKAISWDESKVYVDLSRDSIKNSPEYDPSEPITRDYEKRLYDHYNLTKYWR